MRAKVTFKVLITRDQENKNVTDLQDSFLSIVSEILEAIVNGRQQAICFLLP